MTRQQEIEIIMKDRKTEREAKKYLEKGAIVFEDFEENFEGYMKEWESSMDSENVEKFRKMIETKEPVQDWGVVEYEGKTYYIMYVL